MSTAVLLSQLSFFRGLSPNMLAPLQAACYSIKLDREEVLFRRGERGGEMYIVESGNVRIWIEAEDGREINLAMLGPNEVIGELEMIDGKPRSASVQATEPTRLIVLPREALFDQLGNYPGMAIHLMTVLSERLRRSNEMQLEERGVQSPEERLAHLLLLLSANSPDGRVHNLRTEDAARILAIEIQDIERMLKIWQDREILQFEDDQTLLLLNPEQLEPIALSAG